MQKPLMLELIALHLKLWRSEMHINAVFDRRELCQEKLNINRASQMADHRHRYPIRAKEKWKLVVVVC